MCIVAGLTTLDALAAQHRLCGFAGQVLQYDSASETAPPCSTGWPRRHDPAPNPCRVQSINDPSPGRPPGTLPSRLPARSWGCASLRTGVEATVPPQGSAAALQPRLPPHLCTLRHARAAMLQAAVLLHRQLEDAERRRQLVPYLQTQEDRLRFRSVNRWAKRHKHVPLWDTHAQRTNWWQCNKPSPEEQCQGSLSLHRAAKQNYVQWQSWPA